MEQNWVTYLLTGGFAKGYRTYIIAAVAVVGAVASFSVGDLSLEATIAAVVGAVGLVTAAQH